MGRPDGAPPPQNWPSSQGGQPPPPYYSGQQPSASQPGGAAPYNPTGTAPQGGTSSFAPTAQGNQREERDPVDYQDSPDGAYYRSSRTTTQGAYSYQRTTSTVDQVTDAVPNIFHNFMMDRMEDDGYPIPDELARQRQPYVNRDVAVCLRQIGDELNNHATLNSLIDQMCVNKDTAFGTFASVAGKLFSDGEINWGRIVTLLYFGYRLALKVINTMSLVKTVCGWVVKYIAERIASWIAQRGGWTAIREYYGSTSKSTLAIFCAGLLTGALVYWMNSSK